MSRLSQIIKRISPLQIEAILFSPRVRGFCSDVSQDKGDTAPAAAEPEPAVAAAPSFTYVSAATPADPGHAVGPGASKTGEYPNTEYFTYNKMSYFDFEVEMESDRIVQPAADNGHL